MWPSFVFSPIILFISSALSFLLALIFSTSSLLSSFIDLIISSVVLVSVFWAWAAAAFCSAAFSAFGGSAGVSVFDCCALVESAFGGSACAVVSAFVFVFAVLDLEFFFLVVFCSGVLFWIFSVLGVSSAACVFTSGFWDSALGASTFSASTAGLVSVWAACASAFFAPVFSAASSTVVLALFEVFAAPFSAFFISSAVFLIWSSILSAASASFFLLNVGLLT